MRCARWSAQSGRVHDRCAACIRQLRRRRHRVEAALGAFEPRDAFSLARDAVPIDARWRPGSRVVRASTAGVHVMPEKETLRRARRDKRQGKAPSTQAGEFVREEIHHVREGKHGARSTKQAIAIGLSKARRSGVNLPTPKRAKAATKRSAAAARRAGARRAKPSPRRARATRRALKSEPRRTASRQALARQAKTAARRRTPADRSRAAQRGARTKGPRVRSAAARKAAKTRQRRRRATA